MTQLGVQERVLSMASECEASSLALPDHGLVYQPRERQAEQRHFRFLSGAMGVSEQLGAAAEHPRVRFPTLVSHQPFCRKGGG